MKKNALRIAPCLAILICLANLSARAQSTPSTGPARSGPDPVLQDILIEIRQLRADLLRLNINARRTQALLDRMKVQQEQVVRLTRELGNLRDELASARARQLRTKDALDSAEKRHAAGLVGDAELKALSAELQSLQEREQALAESEPILNTELTSAQGNLAQLNARLDDLEREIAAPAPEPKPPQKKN
jgi:DNA repair exonuclease SbcCD ATPase subunit